MTQQNMGTKPKNKNLPRKFPKKPAKNHLVLSFECRVDNKFRKKMKAITSIQSLR